MADKKISELSQITLSILQSGDVQFVAEVAGYPVDFRVPKNIFLQYVQASSGSVTYTGSTIPANSLGNNGDIYKRSNGEVYFKSSNVWTIIAPANVSKLPPYNPSTTYNTSETVYFQINDTVFQFVSAIDGNTSEPSLSEGVKPWDGPIQQEGIDISYAGVWSEFTNYNKYFYVSKGGHAWESLIDGNNNIDPETDGGVNWLDLGVYTGDYNPSTVYNINELARDGGAGLFKSAINGNNYPTSAETSSTWILIGENPAKPGIAIDTELGEQVVVYTGNRLFPDVRFSLPDGHPYTAGWRYESGNVVFEVGVLASDGVVAYIS